MEDLKVSLNRHCTCIQRECPIWGNCVLCVENHRVNKNHIPECMQELLRDSVATLCRLVEFSPIEKRPTPDVFANLDRAKCIADALRKHQDQPD